MVVVLLVNNTFCWTGILSSKICAASSARIVLPLCLSVFALSNLGELDSGSAMSELNTSNGEVFTLATFLPAVPAVSKPRRFRWVRRDP